MYYFCMREYFTRNTANFSSLLLSSNKYYLIGTLYKTIFKFKQVHFSKHNTYFGLEFDSRGITFKIIKC